MCRMSNIYIIRTGKIAPHGQPSNSCARARFNSAPIESNATLAQLPCSHSSPRLPLPHRLRGSVNVTITLYHWTCDQLDSDKTRSLRKPKKNNDIVSVITSITIPLGFPFACFDLVVCGVSHATSDHIDHHKKGIFSRITSVDIECASKSIHFNTHRSHILSFN